MYRFRDTLPIDISEKTISGDLVTIENPEEMGVVDALEVSLEPIQAGSGEPSPSNVRAISGRAEVVTNVAGKNLLPIIERTATTVGVTATVNADGSVTLNGTATGNGGILLTESTSGKWLTEGTYYGKLFGNNLEGLSFQVYNNGSAIMTKPSGSFVIPSGSETNYIRVRWASGTTFNNVTVYPMLTIGTTEPTAYIAPQTKTYTTSLGRTVYGGTLDVVSGVLTVDRAMVDLGSLTWTRNTTDYSYPYFYTNGIAGYTAGELACSCYKYVSGGKASLTDGTISCYSATSTRIAIRDDNYTDATAFKTAMSGQTVVHLLATPQTYQLTPQQISMLLGGNHVWSDGEISVVWHKDLTKGRTLPTEAVSINGQYIENVLDGYRTLYTKGRESLGAELNTYSVGTADGEKFKSKRYPARELTVGFQLIGDNAEDFREKFNNLNNLLSLDEADFIFHDEEDKFFSGYPVMDAEVEAGQNSVKGEWRIYCAYPFKRSVEPITLTMDDATVTNTTATWAIDYKGAQPARPILRAKFAGATSGGSSGEDGDCGFVAFMDGRENVIQLGNPEVLDLDEYTKAGTLVNKEFVNTSGWTVNGGHNHGGAISGSISTSNTVDAYWDGGKGQTQSYAKPTYGDTGRVNMHGPTLWKNTTGAVNFTLSAVHRLCVEKSNEYGKFELGAYNHETGTMVAGFTITKTSNGTTGTVRYIANGEVVGTDKIDLSYNNTHFGYCKRSEVYTTQTYKERAWVKVQVPIGKNKYQTKSQLQWVTKTRQVFSGYTYTQSNLNSSIQKAGAYVYFQVGNRPKRTFNVPEIEQMVAHDASCYMGAYKTAMHTNMVHSIVFRRQAVTAFAEQPNVFTAGDIVEADCNEATVNIYHAGSMGGHLEPQYGALGNDWENFLLTSGANVIQATWSDWVNPTYKPQIEIEYNEVFI